MENPNVKAMTTAMPLPKRLENIPLNVAAISIGPPSIFRWQNIDGNNEVPLRLKPLAQHSASLHADKDVHCGPYWWFLK
jgi:hypothetical protein